MIFILPQSRPVLIRSSTFLILSGMFKSLVWLGRGSNPQRPANSGRCRNQATAPVFFLFFFFTCKCPSKQNMSWGIAFPTWLHVRRAKTQTSLYIRAGWSESSLFVWWRFGSFATRRVPSEDSDQTARMRRLIRDFVGRTCSLEGNTASRLTLFLLFVPRNWLVKLTFR